MANAVIRVMLAPACAACGDVLSRPLEGPVCGACWSGVRRLTPPLCVQCGDDLASRQVTGPLCARCASREPPIRLARSAAHYEGSMRRIIHAFKYERRRPLAHQLAALMREAGADVLAGADAVVPVPLHRWRRLQRGFNQAEDLSCRLGLPVWRALRRRRNDPPQAGLPAATRRTNVHAAFALRRALYLARPTSLLRGKAIVLVDDVMTTGATLDACAVVLREAGVRSVRALTVARASGLPPAQSRPQLGPSCSPR